MLSCQEFRPDWASAPGDTIADFLKERALSEVEFARQIGHPLDYARSLLQGRATITIAIARKLERVLGASIEFWMARDFQYRQDITRLHEADDEWLGQLPVGDMIKFGWISPVPYPFDEIAACLNFFGVQSIREWRDKYLNLKPMAVFRTSPSFDSRPAAVAAWLRKGEIEAATINCKPWHPARFQESLSDIRSLTREKDPGRFIPKLQQCCAKSGVAVAVVRTPSGCRASGATRFLSQNKALLQLSFRYLTDDHFWFSFMHEAGHLILHGQRGFFLEGVATTSNAEEQEANEFAVQALFSSEFRQALLELKSEAREVIRFAMRSGVSPGIVVGQLQYMGKIRHNQMNSLKRRFEWQD